jgi:hypothetical protein
LKQPGAMEATIEPELTRKQEIANLNISRTKCYFEKFSYSVVNVQREFKTTLACGYLVFAKAYGA